MPLASPSSLSSAAPRSGPLWPRWAALTGGLLAALILLAAAPGTAGLPVSGAAADTTDADTLEANPLEANPLEADTTQDSTRARPRLAVPNLERAPAARLDFGSPPHIAVAPADSVGIDSLQQAARAARRAARYLPRLGDRRPRTAKLLPERHRFLGEGLGSSYEITADSLGTTYTARTRVGERDVRAPLTVDRDAYLRARRHRDLEANWRDLTEELGQRQQQTRGGLGVNIAVPGGRSSAFSTLFGSPEVDLRVTGLADIQAGFDYRKSEQQVVATGSPSRLDPDFRQDLRLGITGSVGDKMQIDVNWDTQSQFDYQNQVKLNYTGYEDEIIQSIEAGNVFLETPSNLIQGGQSLFGIKGQFQIGNVGITTVASQQEGQSSSLSIEGGSETSSFTLQPIDYDEDQHFFLAYYFRNRWNDALAANPPNVTLDGRFQSISDIEVWKFQRANAIDDSNVRQVAAVVDLGEDPLLLTEAGSYTSAVLPSDDLDQYTAADLATLRDPNVTNTTVAETFGLSSSEYQSGRFRKLEEGRDYEYDDALGYLSLNQRLQDTEALAVAFTYRTVNGAAVRIGDLASANPEGDGQGAQRLVLKLLRPANLSQPTATRNPAAWYLMMRNIYNLRGRNFQPDNFELQLNYDPPGRPLQTRLDSVGGRQTLLQLLGLDRVNQNRSPQPDERFDFLPGITIDPEAGRLIFPYLEPFGQRLADAIGQQEGAQRLRDEYVFSSLYRQKKETASDNNLSDIYLISGSYKGNAQAFYDLGAFSGVVEGSVRVTAGGAQLEEGADYAVDYQSGTVNITNESYLAPGRNINITFEQNAFLNIQKKTLLGARMAYTFRDRFSLGGTVMRLSENAPADKFRIGEEPISNTILGIDGSADLEPRWLTRAVDALPLVQTRAPSAVSVSGEFAQLRPGHTDTEAFDRTRRNLEEEGRDFTSDELGGISYVDDFEGFERSASLKSQLRSWQLSAPPATLGGPAQTPLERSRQRGMMGFYQINQATLRALDDAPNLDDEAVQLVDVRSVFPGRDQSGSITDKLSTFDVYFDPQERGPYNYTENLQGLLSDPRSVWGGITQRLPEDYTDFSLNNVEFVEFIFRPHSDAPGGDAGPDAKLYVDLGSISEDAFPDEKLNGEDGLSTTDFAGLNRPVLGPVSRLPTTDPNAAVDVEGGRTEDLGLDGLASYTTEGYGQATEQIQFADFLSTLPAGGSGRLGAEVAKARRDPSGDDYHFYNDDYFDDPAFYPDGATVQQRFSRYFTGLEVNSYEAQSRLDAGSERGLARDPDSEDLNFNASIDTENRYFEYRLPLSLDSLRILARPENTEDYVVSEIEDGDQGTGWYLVRIPVRMPTDSVGAIEDFSLIESMRLWTQGHTAPITLRFATLDLVGSEWRESAEVFLDERSQTPPPLDEQQGDPTLTISSVNNEENSFYKPPPRAIISQNRTARGVQQLAREQALALRLADIQPGQQRAIFKTNSGLDLLKYSNLRLFTHLRGRTRNEGTLGIGDIQAQRGPVEVFLRLGANQNTDYYEYTQPLTPSRQGANTAPELWLPENEVNLRLSALNELKVARDNENFRRDTLFARDGETFGYDAARGVRLKVKGTPSLQSVRSLIIGVRNTSSGDVIEEAQVWINELRVTGYDEKRGWAALATADVQLADLGSVQANFRQQTDGFGPLSSTLDQRQQNDALDWSVRTDFQAGRLLPARYGWNIGTTFQLSSQTSTPRFAPSRGDVRLEEILSQTEDDAAVIEAAQTKRTERSFSATVQKEGSRSPFLQKTIDGLSLSYAYSESDARSPSQRIDDQWQWSSQLSYRLTVEKPRTVQPLGFLSGLPLLGPLFDVRFNYVPRALTLTGTASRSFSQRQDRISPLLQESTLLPERLGEQQTFGHTRQFNLEYDPFEFLSLSYRTNTGQSLDEAGADRRFEAIFEEDGAVRTVREDEEGRPFTSLEEANTYLDSLSFNGFAQENIEPVSAGDVFSGLLSGESRARTERYEQQFTGTLRPSFTDGEALNWINLEDVVYQANFGWANGPAGNNRGATARNQLNLRGGVSLSPQNFWRKFGFYRRLEDAGAEDEDAPPPPPAPEAAPSDSTAGDSTAGQEGAGDGSSFLSKLNPLRLLRGTLLTFTGIQDFSVRYTGDRSVTSSNVGRGTTDDIEVDYTLLDALRGNGPSLGYRFGLRRDLDPEQRVLGDALQVSDRLQSGNTVRASTALTPTQALRIDLEWDVNWSEGQSTFLQQGQDQTLQNTTRNGDNEAFVWAFGASYLDFFKQQLAALEGDFASEGILSDDAGDRNGRVALTNESLNDDFRRAFSRDLGTLDGRGLLPFPLPSWNVTYSGLSTLPLLRSLTQNVNLRHGYQARYANRYETSALGGRGDTLTLRPASGNGAGLRALAFERAGFTAENAAVSESFLPLVGLDVSWKGGFTTNVAWNKTNQYRLIPSNSEVSESHTNELTLTARYQKQGLKIPLLPLGRINNRVTLSLTLSRAKNDEQRYSIKRALEEAIATYDGRGFTYDPALALEGDNVTTLQDITRLSITPSIGYQFSNRVSADFQLEYERFDGDSRRPSYTEINGGFNVRVSISN